MRLFTTLLLAGIALGTVSCASRDPVPPSIDMRTVDGGEAMRLRAKCPDGMELETEADDDGEVVFTCVDD